MSEIADCQKIYLGETEQIFIFLFAMRSFSGSELFSHLKKQKKMSYKNVFTKIQRLVELGIRSSGRKIQEKRNHSWPFSGD